MRLVIIGGNGFIGKNATDYFVHRDYEVISCDLSYPVFEEKCVEYHKILDLSQYDDILQKGDTVIYLPCRNVPATSNRNMSFGINENILEAVNFFEKCGTIGVGRIIYSSSGGAVYGDMTNGRPLSENDLPTPISVYGIQKLTIENYLNVICRKYGIKPIILRIANPYGRWQKPFRGQGIIPTYLASALIDINKPIEIWGTGAETRDYIYIDDLMQAFDKSMTYSGCEYIFNVGSGVQHSIDDVIDIIEETVEERFAERIYIKDCISEVKNNLLDCTRIDSEMGWHPQVPLKKGIGILKLMWNFERREFC